MKVIFLDIDGVLSSDSWKEHFYSIIATLGLTTSRMRAKKIWQDEMCDSYGSLFDPVAVSMFEYIIDYVDDVYIVVSSKWKRKHDLNELKDMWKGRRLGGTIIDVTPNLDFSRGEEIKLWLSFHPEVESYVILDDHEEIILEEQNSNFVLVDEQYGLTRPNAVKAIQILNNQ